MEVVDRSRKIIASPLGVSECALQAFSRTVQIRGPLDVGSLDVGSLNIGWALDVGWSLNIGWALDVGSLKIRAARGGTTDFSGGVLETTPSTALCVGSIG